MLRMQYLLCFGHILWLAPGSCFRCAGASSCALCLVVSFRCARVRYEHVELVFRFAGASL